LFKTALMLFDVFRRVHVGREKRVTALACPSVLQHVSSWLPLDGFSHFFERERRSPKFCLTAVLTIFGARQQFESNQLLHLYGKTEYVCIVDGYL